MLTRIHKWGNSLGLRIPKAFAEEARVAAGSTVEIRVEDGRFIVQPLRTSFYRLEDLLSGVRKDNLHEEIATGDALGREAW